MAKTLSTGNGDWAVQISTPKKKNETTNGRKLTGRKVEIRKYGPLANERRNTFNNFAKESKRRVEIMVNHIIESVKNWRRDMLAKIDMTHQHILRVHNLQNLSNFEPEQLLLTENVLSDKKCDIFPSMPILIDENCNSLMKPTLSPMSNRIVKRRNTVCTSPPDQSSPPFDEIPLRRNHPRYIHSSAIAIAKKQLTFETPFKVETPINSEALEDTVICNVAESKMGKVPNRNIPRLALLQKLLETRKLVLENQKRVQEANFHGVTDAETQTTI